jgi:hypothetical protein
MGPAKGFKPQGQISEGQGHCIKCQKEYTCEIWKLSTGTNQSKVITKVKGCADGQTNRCDYYELPAILKQVP